MPAGLASLWSFAEILRLAAGDVLDVESAELRVGLQPVRIGRSETRRIFLSDALENGAGYSMRLAERGTMNSVLARMLDLRGRFEAHADRCDSSCPDCLRSYDNRLLHSVLDWRLALDIAEIAAGAPLDGDRWLGRAREAAQAFANGFQTRGFACQVRDAGPLVELFGPQNAVSVILTHPLWISDDSSAWTDAQSAAEATARRNGAVQVLFCDVWSLDRSPDRLMPEFLPR